MKLSKKEFVERSIKVHGNIYDYGLSLYINNHTKVKILCKNHGIFEQIPSSHMNGHGCVLCGIEFSSNNKRMSGEDFVDRIMRKHGNCYDYSFIKYIDYETEVSVVCKKHGIFNKKPSDLMEGRGCPKCGREKGHRNNRSCTDEFICSAKNIHGDKYDYSQVAYETCDKKVKIMCTPHGIFEQAPSSHLAGRGCPKCGLEKIRNERILSREDFINRSNIIYKNKYDYHLVYYHNNYTKVKIVCAKHGVFETAPMSHMAGHGCAKCAFERAAHKSRDTVESFIRKSIEIHGDKYDYSLVCYKNSGTKVKILCPKHGVFEQTAKGHIKGKGCPKCGKEAMGLKRRSDTDIFINKAKEVHDNKYDYSLVNYVIDTIKVKIICPKHGIFEQTPNGHLCGNGCRFCNNSKGENRLAKYLRYYRILFERQKFFEKCRNKNMLPFDFYLPALNTCIEYDGIHHFLPVRGDKSYIETKNNDLIKTNFCLKNNINLIRIPYTMKKLDILNVIEDLENK